MASQNEIAGDGMWGYTELKTMNFSYTWTIKNYSAISNSTCKNGVLASPTFKANSDDCTAWHLELSTSKTDSSLFCLNLVAVKDSLTDVTAKHSWYLVKPNEDKRKHSICKNSFRPYTKTNSNFKVSFEKNLLCEYLIEDTLTILTDISMFDKQHVLTSNDDNNPVPKCNLSDDFSKMLESGYFSDVTLYVEGKPVLAHRNILSARSRVFKAMFEHQLTESNTGEVQIEDMEFSTVKLMLEFIYTGNTPELTTETAMNLLSAADRYELERLKVICEEYLCKHLDEDNCLDVLVLSDLHCSDKLRLSCMKFIRRNSDNVLGSERWDRMMNDQPELVTDMCRHLCSSMKI